MSYAAPILHLRMLHDAKGVGISVVFALAVPVLWWPSAADYLRGRGRVRAMLRLRRDITKSMAAHDV